LVPVAPNWTSNEDLLGFYNPLTKTYQDTSFSRFLRDAAREYDSATSEGRVPRPYHLALDEMNLARVEYYFAQFLSAMEIRARQGSAEIELGPGDFVKLPENLFFVGTVNVDETTHGFADKVFDRAQLLELEAPRQLLWNHIGEADYRDLVMEVWDAVSAVAPFAFRVLDEIEAYVSLAEDMGVGWEQAVDEQLVQKVLPKIRGADPRVGEVLTAIMEIAGENLPLTKKKADAMNEAFVQHGFTSYF
jgi:5-methylcytosine-specific restriction endonuclease McrBC GTP-binding regulatory subunit McrB